MSSCGTDDVTKQPEEQGRFAQNIVHFGRVLRAAGLPVGPGKIIDATRAVEAAGITSRDDFYWTLHSVFVNRRDQREIFDQAFHVFWRNPQILERMMSLMLPTIQADGEAEHDTPSRRLLDALFPGRGEGGDDEEAHEQMANALDHADAPEVTLTAPAEEGAYRLFVYVYDGAGHAAHANIPFYVGS